MSEEMTIRETCACGATTEHSGNYLFVADLISKWRKAHAACAPRSAAAPRADDGAILQVIDERDRVQDDFDKAYSLVVGEQPEWSSAFTRTDALDRMDEALAVMARPAVAQEDTRDAERWRVLLGRLDGPREVMMGYTVTRWEINAMGTWRALAEYIDSLLDATATGAMNA